MKTLSPKLASFTPNSSKKKFRLEFRIHCLSFVRNENIKITKDLKYNGLAGTRKVVFEVSSNDDESDIKTQTITK